MSLKAIFFDLDGTLLPMDQNTFTTRYFQELAAVLAPVGFDPQELVAAVWEGTGAMVKNTGEKTNEERFWECFDARTGRAALARPLCDRFYTREFHHAREATGANPRAAQAVALAREGGRRVILATNPVFPLAGQAARLSWLGLRPEDFDLVTSYETDRFCKPNPAYYTSICERIGLSPAECLMIGNDDREDMCAAVSAGLAAYLVTDCRISDTSHPWEGPGGTFDEMLEMLRRL